MEEGIKFFVGLDVHKESISVAVADVGREPARLRGTMPPDVAKLLKLLARYGEPGTVHVVYEAGPTGFGLHRALTKHGYRSEIIAKLVGVAPLNCDSGTIRGQRHIRGGRAVIRQMLYMATLSAMRWEPTIRDFYNRLRKAGKPAKVAMVACMRKIVVILNARRRDEIAQSVGI